MICTFWGPPNQENPLLEGLRLYICVSYVYICVCIYVYTSDISITQKWILVEDPNLEFFISIMCKCYMKSFFVFHSFHYFCKYAHKLCMLICIIRETWFEEALCSNKLRLFGIVTKHIWSNEFNSGIIFKAYFMWG